MIIFDYLFCKCLFNKLFESFQEGKTTDSKLADKKNAA